MNGNHELNHIIHMIKKERKKILYSRFIQIVETKEEINFNLI